MKNVDGSLETSTTSIVIEREPERGDAVNGRISESSGVPER